MKIKIYKDKKKLIIKYLDDENHCYCQLFQYNFNDDFPLEIYQKNFYRVFLKNVEKKNAIRWYTYRDVYIINENKKYTWRDNGHILIVKYDYFLSMLVDAARKMSLNNCLTIIY